MSKFRAQHFKDFDIHFWRTQSGAEVDFVLYKNENDFIPIEVKYRSMKKATIPRSFHSSIDAYQPKVGVILTKDFSSKTKIKNCYVHFIPFDQLNNLFELL